MISLWHLVWIVPVAASVGVFALAMVMINTKQKS